jgi:hypothetical protein
MSGFMLQTPRTRLLVTGTIWVVSYFAVRYVLDARYPPPPWDLYVGGIPIFTFYLFAWAVQSSLRSADELQRRIHLEALAMAFLIAMMAAMFLGLLEDSPRGHLWLPLRDLWFTLPFLYGVCYIASRRHYR